MTGIRFPTGAVIFFSRLSVQTGSGAYPASEPMGTGDEVEETWSWPLTSI